MRNAKLSYALGFSTFESIMFNMGSILIWSIGKIHLPENEFINMWFGIISGTFFLYTANAYLKFLDNKKTYN